MDIKEFADKRFLNDYSDNLLDFAQLVANMHFLVATSGNTQIAWSRGKIYPHSQNMLIEAIRAAYPYLPTQEIYDVWVDCGESIAYCARAVKNRINEEADEMEDLREAHDQEESEKSLTGE